MNLHTQSAFAIVGIICKLHPSSKSHRSDKFSYTDMAYMLINCLIKGSLCKANLGQTELAYPVRARSIFISSALCTERTEPPLS